MTNLNLYRISQKVNHEHDRFIAAVVAAESEAEARLIHPDGRFYDQCNEFVKLEMFPRFWASPEKVEVELVGVALEGAERGVILTSYRG
jgi:hypothetical protein